MSTVLEQVQHRCTRCYRSQTAGAVDIGKELPCEFCGQMLTIPALESEGNELNLQASYSPSRVRSAERTFGAPSDVAWSGPNIDYANGDMLAPLWKRFVGSFIDNLLIAMVFVAGLFIVGALIHQGFIDRHALKYRDLNMHQINAQAVLYFPVLMVLLIQWNLIASRGQSIGKLVLGMKIVGRLGENPGFLRAVIMRNWLRFALSFIPFFSLVDVLVIFGTSRRCIHDYLGGTFVVENYGE